MKRIARLCLLLTLVLGGTGIWMMQLLQTARDIRGLLPSEHPGNVILLITAGIVGIVMLFLMLKGKNREYRICVRFPAEGIGSLFAAAAFAVSAATFYQGVHVMGFARLITAACFAALAFYQLQAKKPKLLISVLICCLNVLLTFEQLRNVMGLTQPQLYLIRGVQTVCFSLYVLYFTMLQTPERSHRNALVFRLGALFFTMLCIPGEDWLYYTGLSLWLLSGCFFKPYAMHLPESVRKCIRKLEKAGYTAYVVGGCVRDALMGITPHDYDLCTNATPEEICQAFEGCKLIRNGEKHGTIGVIMGEAVYEITTYRTEGTYADNRHPDWVQFVDRVEEDLARRDFTVNAMAYHPARGYVDPFGGRQDLFDGIIRAVGDADSRFREDALRILRGVRFACRFRYEVEPKTLQAMQELSPLMENLARERVLSEMTQILCHMTSEDLIRFQTVILQIIPELSPCVGFQQHNRHHKYDVWIHTALVLHYAEPVPALRWAALLHDAGKPEVFTRDEKGQGHFYGHADVSTDIADKVLRRLKASTALREQVVLLVKHHMDILRPEPALLRRKLSKYGASSVLLLAKLQQADRYGTGTFSEDTICEKIEKQVAKLQQEDACLQIRDLAINGHDLMELGFPAGPALGECQKRLLEQVLDGTLPNEREALLAKAREYL